LLPAGYREAATAGISFTQWPKNQHVAPFSKNYALDQKMIAIYYNGPDVLYHHTKFGEIKQRTSKYDVCYVF